MKYKLRELIFITLCCDLGLFSKRLIAPAANVLTDFMRIPGGIGTSFSLMFLVVAAAIVPVRGCAALMGLIQSMIALSLGMVGSMGALSPIGYIVPGIVIDIVLWLFEKTSLPRQPAMVIANMLAAAAAGLTANMIVFNLSGVPLALYVLVALASGSVSGTLSYSLYIRLRPVLAKEEENAKESYRSHHSCSGDRRLYSDIREQERVGGQTGTGHQGRGKGDPRCLGGYRGHGVFR